MSTQERDIGTNDYKIQELVKELREDKFLIPTFQRDFVWDAENILKLWDSIFKFYPIGSILYWETDDYLHTHRQLGGFLLPHDEDSVRKFKEWRYVLDGQQRITSLLVSFLGGKGRVEGDKAFDYTLYFDATSAEFFFADEHPERSKQVSSPRFLIKVKDVPSWRFSFYGEISTEPGFTATIGENLNRLQRIFQDYIVPVVRIRGVEVNEVCDIFERINQEGKRLDPVDIMVARTYQKPDPPGQAGFYLRDNLAEIHNVLTDQGSKFKDMDDLTTIQMFTLCLRKMHQGGRNPYGITPQPLSNLKASDFEEHWDAAHTTILNTIKFLHDLGIQGPAMLPRVYLALPLCYYLHQNSSPNRPILRQWFWRYAFTSDDVRTSSHVYEFCERFAALERGEGMSIPPLVLSKRRLIETSYRYRSTLGRAVLAFLATQQPKDFADAKSTVLDSVYLLLTQAPNLHHVYPQSFMRRKGNLARGLSADSLMNICYLRAKTNIQIGDSSPLAYMQVFADNVPGFDGILESHLIPSDVFATSDEYSPATYEAFLEKRATLLCQRVVQELPDVDVQITD